MASDLAPPPAPRRRWTEAANPLSSDLDVSASDAALVRVLGAVDAGLFSASGGGEPTLPDDEVVAAVARAAGLVAAALAHPRGRVVLGGCGTSGRLSHLEARALNRLAAAHGLRSDCFSHLLAGGDAALLLSQEAAEDMPGAGRDALAALLAAPEAAGAPVVVVGISCGLSATFVGSMLQHALEQPAHVACIALGFNPAEAVRGLRVEGWASSFFEVLADMASPEHAARAVLINPVVGPEAVAGSSRMKGGSATKMVIEAVGLLAVAMASGALPAAAAAHAARVVFGDFEAAVRSVYCEAPRIAGVVGAAAAALTTPVGERADTGAGAGAGAGVADAPAGFLSPTGFGRIIYLGVGTAGLLGLIDSSECPPTYGSLFNDVRCFLGGGWSDLGLSGAGAGGGIVTKAGETLRVPPHLRGDASLPSAAWPEPIEVGVREGFLAPAVLKTLGPADLVVVIAIHGDDTGFGEDGGGGGGDGEGAVAASTRLAAVLEGAAAASHAGCALRHIIVGTRRSDTEGAPSRPFLALEAAVSAVAPVGVRVLLAEARGADLALRLAAGSCRHFTSQLALKLVLNAVTTGAHVRKGTIVRNRMVNVSITNVKLFHRACGIVADVAQSSAAVAHRCVVRAVYSADGGDELRTLEARPVLAHVAAAATQRGLVPVAILLARAESKGGAAGLSVTAARAILQRQRVIRLALVEA